MRRLLAVLVLFAAVSTWAQTSNVTATITDADGQTWNNGTFLVTFQPTPGTNGPFTWNGGQSFTKQFSGVLTAGGVLTVSLPDNTFIAPSGSKWQFTICPNASYQCTNITLAVTGGAPNLSASLSAGISTPRMAANLGAFGYLDVEFGTPSNPLTPGAQYWNVTSNVQRLWTGSVWVNGAGGGASFSAITSGTNTTAAMVVGSGATLGTTGTGWNQATNLFLRNSIFATAPSPLATSLCVGSRNVMGYTFDDVNSNWRANSYIDNTQNPPAFGGHFTWCDTFWLNDSGVTPIFIKNAMFSIYHVTPGTGRASALTNPLVDDRAIATRIEVPAGDVTQHSGLYNEYHELGIFGTPTFTGCDGGSPPGVGATCVEAVGVVVDDQHTGIVNTTGGPVAVRGNVLLHNQGATGTWNGCGICGAGGTFYVKVNTGGNTFSGGTYAGLVAAVTDAPGVPSSNASGIGLYIPFGGVSARMPTTNHGIRIDDFGTQGLDWDIYATGSSTNSGRNFLGGNTWVGGLSNSQGNITVTGNLTGAGGFNTAQFPTPAGGTASYTGTAGATTYTYALTANDANGGRTISSNTNNVVNGAATLDATHTVNVCIANSNLNRGTINFGYVTFDVYRIAGGATQGKIGTITITNTDNNGNAFCLVDNGLAADSGTVPTVNTTGTASFPGYVKEAGNVFRVASNFTTANNTSLQTITGLSFNLLPSTAASYSLHCSLSYSQATATAAVAFGIQASTANPTNIFANGTQQITVGPPGTYVGGTLATLATTTATNIVTGTPGATATNYTAELDGTIEQPANDAGQLVNVMVSTAAGADAVTVLRGSYCRIF